MSREQAVENELLIQRFLDQELSGTERATFLSRLSQDADLRARALELAQLVDGARRLPRPDVPPDFVANVMARTEASPSIIKRVGAIMFAPHDFRWSLAHVAAAACLVLVVLTGGWAVVFGLRDRGSAVPSASIAAVPATTDTTASQAADGTPAQAGGATVLVRLVVLQPGARSVQVAGDFNGWNPGQTSLLPASNGAWTLTLQLAPGRYEYQLVVDGTQWLADPFASEQSDDGFGSRNAVLDVPAAGAAGQAVKETVL